MIQSLRAVMSSGLRTTVRRRSPVRMMTGVVSDRRRARPIWMSSGVTSTKSSAACSVAEAVGAAGAMASDRSVDKAADLVAVVTAPFNRT